MYNTNIIAKETLLHYIKNIETRNLIKTLLKEDWNLLFTHHRACCTLHKFWHSSITPLKKFYAMKNT